MKIDNLYQRFSVKAPGQVNQLQNETQKVARQQIQEEAPLREDRVDISQTSQDIRKTKEILEATPELRTEKVRPIKEQIETGTYQVNERQVANAMITDLLRDLA